MTMTDMKRIILSFAVALAAFPAMAKITLPSVLSDDMVIQRNTEAALWGTATPGKKVTVTTTWSKEKVSVVADSETGKWKLRVRTPEAGGPYEITISDGTALTLHNVLSGDVWYCGGQSNMEMRMQGYASQPAHGAMEKIMTAKVTRPLRICTIKKKSSVQVQETSVGSWGVHSPENVAGASATAYFFADYLQTVLDIPIGILIDSWGGSTIRTWMRQDIIEKEFPEISIDHLKGLKTVKSSDHSSASLLYNGQVAPIIPFTFKGMIWYQGEADRKRPEQYIRLQKAYVEMMRKDFEVPDAPFYYVQIAPYKYSDPDKFTLGYFCEAQQKCLEVIPNSGMAATCDCGEFGTIHPNRKDLVGQRLAAQALVKTYGFKGIDADAPTYKSWEVKDGEILLTLNVGPQGVAPMGRELEGFEVAGADRVFHKAVAMRGKKGTRSNQLVIKCDAVAEPVAIRYCFRNWSQGTVFNNFGIPLAPFRTDNWDDLVK